MYFITKFERLFTEIPWNIRKMCLVVGASYHVILYKIRADERACCLVSSVTMYMYIFELKCQCLQLSIKMNIQLQTRKAV